MYIKPILGSKTLIAEFRADGTLLVEGQFVDQANKQWEIHINQHQNNERIGNIFGCEPKNTRNDLFDRGQKRQIERFGFFKKT
ncbi:hypothetical protein [Paenibacillus sp. S02]|uniref:hypothetical protein n=1 Tax=Paenibacillus sp. S02 TaxID=2823904 RepID=UPI001C64C970|nr:hypothetical protein [Paenibacillus sp. S02]